MFKVKLKYYNEHGVLEWHDLLNANTETENNGEVKPYEFETELEAKNSIYNLGYYLCYDKIGGFDYLIVPLKAEVKSWVKNNS